VDAASVSAALPNGFVVDDAPPTQQMLSAGPAPALPEGFSLDIPDPFAGATNTAARWATFGLTEPVSAAGRAGIEYSLGGGDKSFGDLYQRDLNQQRSQAANFSSAYPGLNALAAAAGAVTPTAPSIGREALGAAASSAPLLPEDASRWADRTAQDTKAMKPASNVRVSIAMNMAARTG
jgi:hypothetical protein